MRSRLEGLGVSPQKLMFRHLAPMQATQLRDGFWGEAPNPSTPTPPNRTPMWGIHNDGAAFLVVHPRYA